MLRRGASAARQSRNAFRERQTFTHRQGLRGRHSSEDGAPKFSGARLLCRSTARFPMNSSIFLAESKKTQFVDYQVTGWVNGASTWIVRIVLPRFGPITW